MTAVLENVNPYSKYGLTRRPTYDEIANLISENEKLTGPLPDRRATRFKASPEGSFFDGMDSLEILKEQQHRIMERQMRELLMRQNLGGGTYNLVRLQRRLNESGVQSEAGALQKDNIHDVSIQAELDEVRRRAVEREQQTGEAHRQGNFLSRNASSMIEGLARRLNPNIQRKPVETVDSSSSSSSTSSSSSSSPKPVRGKGSRKRSKNKGARGSGG